MDGWGPCSLDHTYYSLTNETNNDRILTHVALMTMPSTKAYVSAVSTMARVPPCFSHSVWDALAVSCGKPYQKQSPLEGSHFGFW